MPTKWIERRLNCRAILITLGVFGATPNLYFEDCLLEKANHASGLKIQIDVIEYRPGRQTGHRAHGPK
jgi:hypothetical protein